MGYDLYLKPIEGTLDLQKLHDFFASRLNYKYEDTTFWYNNGNTGVYFSIYFQENLETSEVSDEIAASYPLYFTMNYLRPSFFAYEAQIELSALVDHFSLCVFDPQSQGMGEGSYDAEKFLLGFHHGNQVSYQTMKEVQKHEDQGIQINVMPQKTLNEMWGWNKNRVVYQEHLGKSYYVPPVWPMLIDGMLVTTTIWPDALPSFLPETDFIIISKKTDQTNPDDYGDMQRISVEPWGVIFPHIESYSEKIQTDGYLINKYETPPEELKNFIRSLPENAKKIKRVAFDHIFDEELWGTS